MIPTKLGNGKVEVVWDYTPPETLPDFVDDWKWTIIVRINQLAANRHKYYGRLGKPKPNCPLNVPEKFKELITTHPYYNALTKKLAGRFDVNIVKTDDDFIELDGFMVQIINFNKNRKMERKFKLLVIGHMRHGKDTVAEMIEEITGMSFKSSSEMAAEIFIYDELKDKYGYSSFIECFEDRMNHRAEWHDLIKNYNYPDKAKLAKEILIHNDMYVGMRSQAEIDKCIEDSVFDMIIGVFDPDKPLEPKDSFDIDLFTSSDIIIPTGDLEVVKKKVKKLCDYLLAETHVTSQYSPHVY